MRASSSGTDCAMCEFSATSTSAGPDVPSPSSRRRPAARRSRIEHERCRIAIVAHRVQHTPRDAPVEQPPREYRAVHPALDGTIADDERDGRGQRGGDRSSEGVAAPGDERHMDASPNRGMDRVTILVRQTPLAVEQRAIYVDANQSNHAQFRGRQRSCPPHVSAVASREGGSRTLRAGGRVRIERL